MAKYIGLDTDSKESLFSYQKLLDEINPVRREYQKLSESEEQAKEVAYCLEILGSEDADTYEQVRATVLNKFAHSMTQADAMFSLQYMTEVAELLETHFELAKTEVKIAKDFLAKHEFVKPKMLEYEGITDRDWTHLTPKKFVDSLRIPELRGMRTEHAIEMLQTFSMCIEGIMTSISPELNPSDFVKFCGKERILQPIDFALIMAYREDQHRTNEEK